MLVRCTLRFLWSFTFELFQCVGNVIGHGKVDLTFHIVPINGESEVSFSLPINCHFIMLLKH